MNEPTIDNCDFIKNSPKFIKINSKTQLGILYLSINSNIAVSLEAQIYDEDAWRKMLKSIKKPIDTGPNLKNLKNASRRDVLNSIPLLIDSK